MAGAIYKNPITFAVMATVAILIGSVVTMAYPMLRADMHPKLESLKPITALQLAGRDVYQREGCVGCHTQMIRPLPSEVARYGDFSKAGEFAYEHPFLWGSKRTGPDLARLGGKYPDMWHLRHMDDPRVMTPRSIMPAYPWMLRARTDFQGLPKRLQVLKRTGVPYTPEQVQNAPALAQAQAKKIADNLFAQGGPKAMEDKEVVALIAYLQRLGKAGAK